MTTGDVAQSADKVSEAAHPAVDEAKQSATQGAFEILGSQSEYHPTKGAPSIQTEAPHETNVNAPQTAEAAPPQSDTLQANPDSQHDKSPGDSAEPSTDELSDSEITEKQQSGEAESEKQQSEKQQSAGADSAVKTEDEVGKSPTGPTEDEAEKPPTGPTESSSTEKHPTEPVPPSSSPSTPTVTRAKDYGYAVVAALASLVTVITSLPVDEKCLQWTHKGSEGYMEAKKQLEDAELKAALKQGSKRVKELDLSSFKSTELYDGPHQEREFPGKEQFRSKEGKLDVSAYVTALGATAMAHYTPQWLIMEDTKSEDHSSLSAWTERIERMYMLLPPDLFDYLVNNRLAQIYRWETRATWKYLAIYCVLWWYDIIICLPFVLFIGYVAHRRAFPPDFDELRGRQQLRENMNEESEQLRQEVQSSWTRSKYVNAIFSLGGGDKSGNGKGTGASSESEPPHTMYSMSRKVISVIGPSAQLMIDDLVDLGEIVRNLVLHPDYPATPYVLQKLFAVFVFLAVCPTLILIKLLTAYAALEFFVLWHLRELHPEYRRALSPWWWVFIGAPNDAQWAIYLLDKKSDEAAAAGAAGAAGSAPKASPDGAAAAAAAAAAPAARDAASPAAAGAPASRDLPAEPAPTDATKHPLYVNEHFALYGRIPGCLRIFKDALTFEPTKGLGGLTRSFKVFQSETAPLGRDVSKEPRFQRSLFVIEPSIITNMKKEGGLFGVLGDLKFTLQDQSSHHLRNVSNRDDAFNDIAFLSKE